VTSVWRLGELAIFDRRHALQCIQCTLTDKVCIALDPLAFEHHTKKCYIKYSRQKIKIEQLALILRSLHLRHAREALGVFLLVLFLLTPLLRFAFWLPGEAIEPSISIRYLLLPTWV
jgi:hypothetical protein